MMNKSGIHPPVRDAFAHEPGEAPSNGSQSSSSTRPERFKKPISSSDSWIAARSNDSPRPIWPTNWSLTLAACGGRNGP